MYVLAMLLWLAVIVFYAYWMLKPIMRRIRLYEQPKGVSRFSVSDLLSLTFLMVLPFGILNTIDARFQDPVLAGSGYMLVSIIIWFAGLRAINHLGISRPKKRLVGIAFTFPAAIPGAVLLLPVAGFVGEYVRESSRPRRNEEFKVPAPDSETADTSPYIAVMGFVAITILTRLSAWWIVREDQVQDSGAQPTSPDEQEAHPLDLVDDEIKSVAYEC